MLQIVFKSGKMFGLLLEPGDSIPSDGDCTSSSRRADKFFDPLYTVFKSRVNCEYAQIDLEHTHSSKIEPFASISLYIWSSRGPRLRPFKEYLFIGMKIYGTNWD